MFLIDTEQGCIVSDEELKSEYAQRKPYRTWLDNHQLRLSGLPARDSTANSGFRLAFDPQ